MNRATRLATPTGILLVVASAHGHDFWIEPSTFEPSVGSVLTVGLRIGHHGSSEAVRRDAARIERFVVVGPRGTSNVPGRDGADPAGLVRIDTPGTFVIGFQSKPTFIELPPSAFERYLQHEGLDRIIAERRQRGESDNPGREIFSRCAKSLVCAGTVDSDSHDRALGMRFELLAENRPMHSPTTPSTFRVLFEGQPCPDVQVTAVNLDDPHNESTARSDETGRVRFTLQREGVWFLNAVHMIPAPKTSDADWESLWGSLTFSCGSRSARATE